MDTLPAVIAALKELYALKSIEFDNVQLWCWFITIYRMFIKAINF